MAKGRSMGRIMGSLAAAHDTAVQMGPTFWAGRATVRRSARPRRRHWGHGGHLLVVRREVYLAVTLDGEPLAVGPQFAGLKSLATGGNA
jgi:hypothetical protein